MRFLIDQAVTPKAALLGQVIARVPAEAIAKSAITIDMMCMRIAALPLRPDLRE